MEVREVMTAPAITIRPDATFACAVEQLVVHDISGLPVVDAHGDLVGIISEADLISNEAYDYRHRSKLTLITEYLRDRDPHWIRKASGRTVEQLMTRRPVVVSPDASVSLAARWMLEGPYKRLPVVSEGRVVGVVTRHDLLRVFYRPDAEVEELIARVPGVRRGPLSYLAAGSKIPPTGPTDAGAIVARLHA